MQFARRLAISIAMISLPALSACQLTSATALELQLHQSYLDRDGLLPPIVTRTVSITCSVPPYWQQLPLKKTLLYTHEQWRAPDHRAGVGVAYFHTPIPLSPETIIWFAKGQYTQTAGKDPNGRLIGQWTDSSGRAWFEAENSLYHVRGYAMTRGLEAWIVYSGYRVKSCPQPDEIDLAERSANTVLPWGNAE
jgi:hypothetical protein